MDFGVVLQTDPPASRVVELTKLAEGHGFTYAWTFDSHVLWEEPFIIFEKMLAATERIIVGPMVTNPGTRDWTVLASLFATLNEQLRAQDHLRDGSGRFGAAVHRPQTGHAGDHVRVDEGDQGHGGGRLGHVPGQPVAAPLGRRGRLGSPHVGGRVRAPGPRSDRPRGRRFHPAAGRPARSSSGPWRRSSRPPPTPDATPRRSRSAWRPPPTSATTSTISAKSCAGSGAWSATMLRTWSARYGDDGSTVPRTLTDFIEERQDYDYFHHGKRKNPSADFVPDDIVERFCVLGTAGRPHRQADRTARPGRRPVRHLPHARRPGSDAGGLRPGDHPGAGVAPLNRQAVSSRSGRLTAGFLASGIVSPPPPVE